jgi:25S rRNA (uracil2634-N3)-methyltransferase
MKQHIHFPSSHYVATICELGLKNQRLITRSLDSGFIQQAKQLARIDSHLAWLLCKAAQFDFVGQVAKGSTLLVGEGNLSFTLALTREQRVTPSKLTATTYEKERDLSSGAAANAVKLKSLGVRVLYGLNSAQIETVFAARFETVIFQFPHAGTREPIDGYNPNFILVRDFLKSASRVLVRGGCVLISAVDSPHYRGAFQFEKAAAQAGFEPPVAYPFDPADFPGYSHTMTHQSGSALDHHDDFNTWVFRLK